MEDRDNRKRKMSEEEQKRFEKAEKNYQKLLEEIKPFIKKRKVRPVPAAQEWRASSQDQ